MPWQPGTLFLKPSKLPSWDHLIPPCKLCPFSAAGNLSMSVVEYSIFPLVNLAVLTNTWDLKSVFLFFFFFFSFHHIWMLVNFFQSCLILRICQCGSLKIVCSLNPIAVFCHLFGNPSFIPCQALSQQHPSAYLDHCQSWSPSPMLNQEKRLSSLFSANLVCKALFPGQCLPIYLWPILSETTYPFW